MRVLFDTNVVLDLLLDRQPFAGVAAELVARVERGEVDGYLGATTITTLHYLLSKEVGRDEALATIRRLLALFTIAPVDERTLEVACDVPLKDFEDAVLHEAGRLAGAAVLVTRDGQDFAGGWVAVHSPAELEALLAEQ